VSADLVTWLREQIAEDQRAAEAAQRFHPTPWRVDPEVETTMETGRWVADAADEGVLVANGDAPARFFARWDPARVLTEVAAKRAILDDHRQVTFTDANLGIHNADVCMVCHAHLDYPDHFTEEQGDAWEYPLVQRAWPCPTVRALVAPFASRAGFDPSWLD